MTFHFFLNRLTNCLICRHARFVLPTKAGVFTCDATSIAFLDADQARRERDYYETANNGSGAVTSFAPSLLH